MPPRGSAPDGIHHFSASQDDCGFVIQPIEDFSSHIGRSKPDWEYAKPRPANVFSILRYSQSPHHESTRTDSIMVADVL